VSDALAFLSADAIEALERLIDERVEAKLASRAAVHDWITLEEAAGRLRLSVDAARKRAQRGDLPGAVKDGSRWLVDARAFADLAPPRTVSGDHERRGERRVNGPAPGTRRIP
jgi:hypothetical protein